jgi:hypothetical protein
MIDRERRSLPVVLAVVLALLTLIALSSATSSAQDPPRDGIAAPPSLSEIVDNMTEKNAERTKALEHYRGMRTYQLDYKGFPKNMQAEMVVELSYDAPATEEFTIISQSGPKWMIDRVLKRLLETERESKQGENREHVEVDAENYNFTLLDSHNTEGACPYVLGVEPKVATKFLFRGRVWVDAKDFAVCRIEAEPAQNPSFWIKKTAIHHSYVKIGDFWLPAENKSVSDIRIGGHATLTIRYDHYELPNEPALQLTETQGAVSR